jgi:hypothetical protein
VEQLVGFIGSLGAAPLSPRNRGALAQSARLARSATGGLVRYPPCARCMLHGGSHASRPGA